MGSSANASKPLHAFLDKCALRKNAAAVLNLVVIGCCLTVAGAQSQSQPAVVQVAQAETSPITCVNPASGPGDACSPLLATLTVSFAPTQPGDSLVVFYLNKGSYVQPTWSCVNNLGTKSIIEPALEFYGGPSGILGEGVSSPATPGISSITCNFPTNIGPFIYNSVAIVVYEIRGVTHPINVESLSATQFSCNYPGTQNSSSFSIYAVETSAGGPNPTTASVTPSSFSTAVNLTSLPNLSVWQPNWGPPPGPSYSSTTLATFTTSGLFNGLFTAGSDPNPICVGYIFAPAKADTYIQAQMISPPEDPTTPILTSDPESKTAHVPLGSTFSLTLLSKNADGSFTPIPSTFSLGSAQLSYPPDDKSLFPNNVVFNYQSDGAQPGSLVFQAVHTGTHNLTITPYNASTAPVQMTIQVEDPAPPDSSNLAALGTTHPEVDYLVIPVADGKGIPPQYIKAQMSRESGGKFNPSAYRYEPLNRDVGDYGPISQNQDYRSATNPYTHFRISTQADCYDSALAAGDQLLPADVSPAQIYRGWSQGVTAWDLIQQNLDQRWQNYSPAAYNDLASQQQANSKCGSYLTWVWTAQTDLAASYGYMQITYVTAIDTMHWQGVYGQTGLRNPSLLFDTPGHQANDGGSLILGTGYMAKLLQQIHSPDVNNPQFNAVSDFQDIFLDGWAYYNGIKGDDPYGYAQDVLQRSQGYLPNHASPIFVGGTQ